MSKVCGLRVKEPGFQVLTQDGGRTGVGHNGLSQGGMADEWAGRWGNYLLENPLNTTVIEVALGQCVFQAEGNLTVALTGADMSATINGAPASNWCTHALRHGDTLQLHAAKAGIFSYISVAGGLNIPDVMGSTSTVVRNQMGGLNGGPLQAGDLLPCTQPDRAPRFIRQVPWRYIPDYREPLTLHLLESYQHEAFSKEIKETLYNEKFRISPRSNRMGCQLEGPDLSHALEQLPSEGIAAGAVQIPASGQPLILLKDRQTIGGYPKIGCIIREDLSALSQRRPGDKAQFQAITGDIATRRWLKFQHFN